MIPGDIEAITADIFCLFFKSEQTSSEIFLLEPFAKKRVAKQVFSS